MPNRMLRDWTDSEKVNQLTAEGERFFTRLIMKADDYGCFYADTRLLRANLFPLVIEKVFESDIEKWIEELARVELITLYTHNNKGYLQIVDFGQRLDKARSKYPKPDGDEIKTGGYVYVAKCDTGGLYKIGYSLNPWARIREIKSPNGGKSSLFAHFVGTTNDEKIIHDLLRDQNYEGEWFKLSKNIIDCFSECLINKLSTVDVIVAIRSNRSPAEVEAEVEVERKKKKKDTPKGDAGAVAPAGDLHGLYDKLEKSKKNVYDFIATNKPSFIDPYVDIWNIFATQRKLPKVTKLSNSRKRKFAVRMNEKGFDFLEVLKKAGQSSFLLSGNWFGFDWIFENDSNWLKVIEGKYDHKSAQQIADAKKSVDPSTPTPIKTFTDEVSYLFGRYQEGELNQNLMSEDFCRKFILNYDIPTEAVESIKLPTELERMRAAVVSMFRQRSELKKQEVPA